MNELLRDVKVTQKISYQGTIYHVLGARGSKRAVTDSQGRLRWLDSGVEVEVIGRTVGEEKMLKAFSEAKTLLDKTKKANERLKRDMANIIECIEQLNKKLKKYGME